MEFTYQGCDQDGNFWLPKLANLFFSVLGMLAGSLLPQLIGVRPLLDTILGATA